MKAIRQTSIDAYNEILFNGLLSKRRWEVYNFLYQNGPLTAEEIRVALCPNLGNGITPRLSELKALGVIVEVGTKKNPSGMEAILWDVTGNLPIALPKKEKTYKFSKQQLIDAGADLTKLGVK